MDICESKGISSIEPMFQFKFKKMFMMMQLFLVACSALFGEK